MSDQRLRDLGVRIEESTPTRDFDVLVDRARRRVAIRRAGTLAAVVVTTIAVLVGLAQIADRNRQTGPPPVDRSDHARALWCPKDRRPDCFAGIHGWIVYGGPGSHAIRALDPADPGDPEGQIRLHERWGEEPLEWSRDGTKLLIRRTVAGSPDSGGTQYEHDLVVLNADGTEDKLAHGWYSIDGSFSPDGSQVVYAWGGIYKVDLDGGNPRLVLPLPAETGLYNPAFSPDGTHIAYFDGGGDSDHSLRVMRSDGTGIRALFDRVDDPAHIEDLAWSPDGQRLMFAGGVLDEGGIWTIGVDGSGLTQVIPDAVNPAWSPDGTRISYQTKRRNEYGVPVGAGGLRIADADGAHVTRFGYGGSGPWNPIQADR